MIRSVALGRFTMRLLRGVFAMATIAVAVQAQAGEAITDAACMANPLGDRDLYLRGPFNNWQATSDARFDYVCNRFVLTTKLRGKQQFKIADENWSADADWGGTPAALRRRGPALEMTFDHDTQITLAMSQPEPSLTVANCPAPPFGETTLFLRGTMNNWGALEQYAFQYDCDAYYLNVDLNGAHEFKVADGAWTVAATIASADGSLRAAALAAGTDVGGMRYAFAGKHTVRLVVAAGKVSMHIGPRTFRDANADVVTDPVARSVAFDSRHAGNKQPFGAVTAGTELCFTIKALPGVTAATLVTETRTLTGNQEVLDYAPWQRVAMQRQAAATDGLEHWHACARPDQPAIYGYYFELDIGGRRYVYQNNANPVFWTREAGDMGVGEIAVAPASARRIRRYRQTVYAADFQVPGWARDAVYYYIFPDRFRNGNPANDPKPGRNRYHDSTVELHANWLDKPWRPNTGDGSDAHHNNDFFGGDLAGITEKLDDIADLGANTLYMTPIFRAASNHKYDTADYRQIDPAFGTDADFDRLIAEARRRGIRVILDTSLNHVGADSIYFDRYGNFGGQGAFARGRINPSSPYADWFKFHTGETLPDKQYEGWVGVRDLPELDKSSSSYRDFAIRAPDSVSKRWLDRGTAGWRMDVAPWVPDDFWREWRREVKRHRPDAITVAETWFDASKFFLGDMFDSTMNYILRNTVIEYAKGGDARALYGNIELMREAYPPQAFYALMNVLSSHDQARTLHLLGETDGADADAIALARRKLRLAVLFQMSFPGAPAIFYGDEVGVSGGDDPYNRGTYPWADRGGKPDASLRADFKRMIGWRNTHAILRHGSLDAPLYLDANVIVMHRAYEGRHALVVLNNAGSDRRVEIALPETLGRMRWQRIGMSATVSAHAGKLTLDIPAIGGAIYLSE